MKRLVILAALALFGAARAASAHGDYSGPDYAAPYPASGPSYNFYGPTTNYFGPAPADESGYGPGSYSPYGGPGDYYGDYGPPSYDDMRLDPWHSYDGEGGLANGY